jgi:limonene-1,2-epoxide hydrolase
MPAGRRTVALLAVVAAAAAGCGGSSGAGSTTTSTGAGERDPGPIPQHSDLELPAGVPDRATRPAARESRRVINAWLRALRRGDVRRAAHFWALPSKYQNGTPVLTVDSERERIAVNIALPCGAKAIAMGGAGAYTIVSFRLTTRPGGDCGTGVGGTARGAIKVQGGKIAEWYRLPDEPGGAQQAPPAPSTPTPSI